MTVCDDCMKTPPEGLGTRIEVQLPNRGCGVCGKKGLLYVKSVPLSMPWKKQSSI